MLKRIKFYTYKVIENSRITGIIELLLLTGTIITAVFWLKYDKQELEPITIIFLAIIGFISALKIIIAKPIIPKLTFSEYVSENKMEASFFMGSTFADLKETLSIAKKENKGVFLVIYDSKHSTNSQLNYSLGCFTRYEMTKRLINEYFIQAIVSMDSYDTHKYIPNNYHMENCLLIVLDNKLDVIRQEGVYANADEGLKRVKNDIEKMNR